jgi:formate-dependent nitrite reductase membrane component NrfD
LPRVDLFLMTLAAGLLILLNLRLLHHWSAPKPLPLWADIVAPAAILLGVTLGAFVTFQPTDAILSGSWLLVLGFVVGILRLSQRRELRHVPLCAGLSALAGRLGRGLPWLSVLIGVALGLYAGSVLAVVGARPAWSSLLLPIFFLGYGLAAAAGVLVLARPRPDAEAVRRTEVLYVALALAAGAAYIYNTSLVWSLGALGGPGAALWTVGLGAGLALPLVLAVGASAWRGLRPLADRATPWLILLGGLVLRQALVAASQARA